MEILKKARMRRASKRASSSIAGTLSWIKPSLHLLSIPGYIDDGQAWSTIWRSVGVAMTTLDWILLALGVPFFLHATGVYTWPRRLWGQLSFDRLRGTVAYPDTPSSVVSASADKYRQPATVRKTDALNRQPIPSLPEAGRWVSKDAALQTLKSSSLVRLRLPPFGGVHPAYLRLSDELCRHLIRNFEQEYPEGVRNGEYRLELLEWWIDATAYKEQRKTL